MRGWVPRRNAVPYPVFAGRKHGGDAWLPPRVFSSDPESGGIGNAVPVLFAKGIAEAMYDVLKSKL